MKPLSIHAIEKAVDLTKRAEIRGTLYYGDNQVALVFEPARNDWLLVQKVGHDPITVVARGITACRNFVELVEAHV